MPFSSNLNVVINLNENTNGLYTVRIYKETLLLFLGTMLGSVFGIMGSFGGILRIAEESSLHTNKFFAEREKKNKVKLEKKKIKGYLNNQKDKENSHFTNYME